MRVGVAGILAAALALGSGAQAQEKPTPPPPAQPEKPGRSEPTFQWPSIAPGVDYTLPTEAEIQAPLVRAGCGGTAGFTPYLAVAPLSGASAVYYAGSAWDRAGQIASVEAWDAYIAREAARLRAPVSLRLEKAGSSGASGIAR